MLSCNCFNKYLIFEMLGIYRQVTAFIKSLPSSVFLLLLVVFLMLCFKQKNLSVGTETKKTVTEVTKDQTMYLEYR